MTQSRQLAAIMFTDIVGYTALMGNDSAKALELVRISKEIQKPLVEKYNGQWLKEMGDGALAKFGTALDAVNCAIEIQELARTKFDGKLRIGIHSGDVTIENEDVYGDGVNIASRLQSIADPGGIYISESIEKAIRGQMKIELKYLGKKRFKNVDYGVRTYAIQGMGLPEPGSDQGYKGLAMARTYKWIALLSTGLLVAWTLYFFIYSIDASEEAGERSAVYLQITLPTDVYLATDTGYPIVDISPDGSTVVFVGINSGRQDIYLKRFNDPGIRILEGTKDGIHPFFSPDGLWIGFLRGSTLMKIPTTGGVPIAVHDIIGMSVNRGLTWYQKDSIVYTPSSDGGLSISSIEGENKRSLTDWKTLLDGEPYYWPYAVNKLNAVLFTDFRSNKSEEQNIGLYLLDKQEILHLVNGGTFPKYSGRTIFFTRNKTLFKVAFDLNTKKVGDSKILVEGLYTNFNGSSLYAVGGMNLVYIQESREEGQDQLVWVDRVGNADVVFSNGKDLDLPKISPSGDRIALTISDGPNLDLWMFEPARNSLTRLTSHPGEDFGAIWHPTDQLLAFSSEIAQTFEEEGLREGGPGIALLDIETNKPPERYLTTPGNGYWEFPISWAPDGERLMFVATKGNLLGSLEILDVGRKKRTTWLETSHDEEGATFSPSGKWVAYISNMSGRDEIYLKPFHGDGAPIQVSTEGGTEPVWSPDGKEIFYRISDKMMSVKIINEAPMQLAKPVMLFEKPFKRVDYGGMQANYDISPDGSQFLMIRNTSETKHRVVNVILNWDKL